MTCLTLYRVCRASNEPCTRRTCAGHTGRDRIRRRSICKSIVAHFDRVVSRQPSDGLSYLASLNTVFRSQKYFWDLSSTSNWSLIRWRHHDVEVPSWRWRWAQKKIWDRKMNKRDHSVQYDHSDISIRHDPAEIRGLVVVAPSHSQDFSIC